MFAHLAGLLGRWVAIWQDEVERDHEPPATGLGASAVAVAAITAESDAHRDANVFDWRSLVAAAEDLKAGMQALTPLMECPIAQCILCTGQNMALRAKHNLGDMRWISLTGL